MKVSREGLLPKIFVLGLIVVAAIFAWLYFDQKQLNTSLHNDLQSVQADLNESRKNDVPSDFTDLSDNEIAKIVSKIYRLPDDEIPSVATVEDVTKLRDQAFFDFAENGDLVLIYTNNDLAVLYRPSSNQIIGTGPIINAQ